MLPVICVEHLAITKSDSMRHQSKGSYGTQTRGTGYVNLSVGLGYALQARSDPPHSLGHVHPPMSLILTIFALVFVTELISWIGKSVLLHFVRLFCTPDLSDSSGANPTTRRGPRTKESSTGMPRVVSGNSSRKYC